MKHHSLSRDLLCCRRPNQLDDGLSALKKAERVLESNSEAMAGYSRQRDLDRRVSQALDLNTISPETRQEIAGAWQQVLAERHRARSKMAHPAFLVVLFALVTLAVFIALRTGDSMKSFPGDELIVRFVELSERAREGKAEVANGPLSEQGDTLFMRGIERFAVPEQFVDWPVEHIKIHNINQNPVAQLVSNDSVSFFIFEEGDFKMELNPDGKWFLLEKRGLTAAVRKIDGVVFVVVAPGGPELFAKKLEIAD